MADELDYLELLIASERISGWVRVISSSQASQAAKNRVVLDMAAAVKAREAYVEEVRARSAAVAPALNNFLHTTAMSVVTKVELDAAFKQQVQRFRYGHVSVTIREGALQDGLGARVWAIAHTMCRHLVDNPALVRGRRVLELGSGTGLCGIVAAKLGAAEVLMTDNEPKVLAILNDCAASNFEQAAAGPQLGHVGVAQPHAAAREQHTVPANMADQQDAAAGAADLADPDDASSCEDLDDFLQPQTGHQEPGMTQTWDHGNMRVRRLDWVEALQSMPTQPLMALELGLGPDSAQVVLSSPPSCGPGMAVQPQQTGTGASNLAFPPNVPRDDQFEVILGTDILYEAAHASLVAAVLKQRLQPGGRALIACAVRDKVCLLMN
eukprot:jgi/Astpho2/3696/Aster-04885